MNEFESDFNALLMSAFNRILKYEELYLKRVFDVSVTEAHLIDAIGCLDNQTVSEVAARLMVAVPTATISIKKLSQRGLAEKRPCPKDGRKAYISLTSAGRRIYKAHRFFHKKLVRQLSGDLDEQEKQTLLNTMKKLNQFFEGVTDEIDTKSDGAAEYEP